ncbi:MAG: HAD family hydrolase [Johnsonella sp.]|nr:HAD family hydrolase [Johnsonella sp.]
MIRTILFDMGGTLEDICYNEESKELASKTIYRIITEHGLEIKESREAFWKKVLLGMDEYKAWSESNKIEKKPEEIWGEYLLRDIDLDHAKAKEIAEELAGIWEVTYYQRKLRPKVEETLEILKNRGYRLGVISNTCSLYSVFDVLDGYQIREYFEDITLSSVTGYRKPHKEIFSLALRQMKAKASESAYVGDTISRDIIGSKNAGFGMAIQIKSFLSPEKDLHVEKAIRADKEITRIDELLNIFDDISDKKA